jgi:protein-arginine kinase activator protein McsA
MQKHDKMVALAKEKSAEMAETAITAIENMYRNNVKISVAELMKQTGLSRGFFYNNQNVKQILMELKEKQQGKTLKNPKSEAIAKAQEARIKDLEKKLSESIPASEYEKLQKKYKELEHKYSQIKNGSLLKIYEQL